MLIGRFAPTPSGGLHFGSLVAALASFLSARRQGGRWLVRMEDVDQLRCEPGADALILRQLEQYALHWDGDVLYQSTRSEAYRAARDALMHAGWAYACRCSRTHIRAAATRWNREGALYPGTCRSLGLHAAKSLVKNLAVRLDTAKVQAGAIVEFMDGALGAQACDVAQDWGDFVLWRVEDLAAYHLAVVVDDAWQGVTEVVRGADLLDSTPRQILLQRALGLPTPRYTHVPLALAANGQKLSKQNLAPCLPLTSPGEDLWDALVFLGERPPQALCGASPEELLHWALSM
ncbi:MAG: tRNA glutamyl-Q(34) synthetase GluQRS [Gammaproteobacteria bacterium 28-57-27]|nr:MAG: tRNA glutamyl-Q(34) synthetase GluQRS [Gammaproteobacteria bacterium 28-57-27]